MVFTISIKLLSYFIAVVLNALNYDCFTKLRELFNVLNEFKSKQFIKLVRLLSVDFGLHNVSHLN